jgi:hypothetical protein
MKAGFIISIILIIAFAITFLLGRGCNHPHDNSTEQNNTAALTDTIRILRQLDSTLIATIASYQANNKAQFLALASKDSTIIALQGMVKDFKGRLQAAGAFTTETKFTATGKTKIVHDTAYIGSQSYPTYTTDFQLGRWVHGDVVANSDSIVVTPSVYDEYELGFGYDKSGKAYGEVKTHNPYNTIKTFRSYNLALPKQKRYGIGIQAGYGLMYIAPLNRVYHGVTLSIGISRHIVEF